MEVGNAPLLPRRIGIDTHQEYVIYMRTDCHVCRAEGFTAHARVEVSIGSRRILATLNTVESDWLSHDEFGLSESAWKALAPRSGEWATFAHAPAVQSMRAVRAKIYGHALRDDQFEQIILDVSGGLYTDIELAAFVAACGGDRLTRDEVVALTRAMFRAGNSLSWPDDIVVDKHCVGGLPGNRTTPIVVAIVASHGLLIPKTSSRAITSPAGTADTMEMLAPVNLSLSEMRRVVEHEHGCIVWGGAVELSPADDILIRIERALDIDSEGQLVASVLSKKAAAGSTHVIIDIPVGGTAKVRSMEDGERLSSLLTWTAQRIGLQLRCVITDGSQPVGRGIGPALEARDLLAVFQNAPEAPGDLRARAIRLAGEVLEIAGIASDGTGGKLAEQTLTDGRAWEKFQAICEAQGGMRIPPRAPLRHEVTAQRSGKIIGIDNRLLSKLAKLAGAPGVPAAGVYLHCAVGRLVAKGEPLFELHAETQGELDYALAYFRDVGTIFEMDEA